MSEKIIQVNIVTPRGVVFTHRALKVSVVTVSGGLTLLPNHIPIVTPLGIGAVSVTRLDNDLVNYIAVNGGVLEFSNNVCNIIADTAERERDIDKKRAEDTKEWAESEIHAAEESHDGVRLQRAKLALNKAVNRIGVSNRLK